MRKLSSVLLPVAAVGALVGSTLALAGPAAADSWGYRSERHEHVDRARGGDRFDGRRHESRGDRGRRNGASRSDGHRWR